MIRTLHFLAAMVAAILVECTLGNLHIAFPVTVCVLYFMGRTLPFWALTGIGLLTGLLFDLLYFHDFPQALWLFSISLGTAWVIGNKMKTSASFWSLLLAGLVLGIVVTGGNLVHSSGSVAVLFCMKSFFNILCTPLFLILLWLLFDREPQKVHAEKKPTPKKTVLKRKPKTAVQGKRSKA